MTRFHPTTDNVVRFALLTTLGVLVACGGGDSDPASPSEGREFGPPALVASGLPSTGVSEDVEAGLEAMVQAVAASDALAELTVDYPLDESIFPPEFTPPTFLWHDSDPRTDVWLVDIDFSMGTAPSISLLVPGDPPPKGWTDERTWGATNEPYHGTEYQRSAKSWTPAAPLW
ncbi:MAG: hypothetical protein GF355_03170, partial [Candidatus Eisenbacteria bacterium]|nr:hypothetical protein [Candidatus Eisenbacteria bacterium]